MIVSRVDSWVNALTGLGTLRDKLTHAQITPGVKLADATLEALFNDDDLGKRLVTKIPREATRRGFELALEGAAASDSADRAREIMDQWKLLGCMPKLRKAWIWGRLYAGGAVFVGADDGASDLRQPLNETAIRSIEYLLVFKRPELTIDSRYSDIRQPKYGEPEIYRVRAPKTIGGPLENTEQYVHESRLIMFEGVEAARTYQTSSDGFEDSVLQAVHEQIRNCATAWQSVAHLLSDASQGVLAIDGLMDLIAARGQDTLRTRIQMMDLARSVCRAILVDAERERFERVATSFAGIPEVLDRLMMRASASFEMPVTILFGRSPAGLNATGESDIRGWYDTVQDEQTEVLKPRVERLLRLLMLAKNSPTKGVLPERWEVRFKPLWQPTDKEHADTLKVKADTHAVLVEKEIMFPAEAALGLAHDFPTIDQEHRRALLDADLDAGLKPGEGEDPEGDEDDPDDDDDGGEGGGNSTSPKAREDRQDRKSAAKQLSASRQPRVPKGSPDGGQWSSGGGGAGGGSSGGGGGGAAGGGGGSGGGAGAGGGSGSGGATSTHNTEQLTHEQKAKVDAVKTKAAAKAAAKKKENESKQTEDEKANIGGGTSGQRKTVNDISVDDGAPTGARELEIAPRHFDAAQADRVHSQREQIADPKNRRQDELTQYGGETPATVAASMGQEAGWSARRWSEEWAYNTTDEGAQEVIKGMGEKGSWVQGYYHATQASLKSQLHELQKAGIADEHGNVTLYRGVRGKQAGAIREKGAVGTSVDLGVRGLSSWTTDVAIARGFATGEQHGQKAKAGGVVMAQKVHHSRIFATHTGNAARDSMWRKEREYTVLAPEGQITAQIHSAL